VRLELSVRRPARGEAKWPSRTKALRRGSGSGLVGIRTIAAADGGKSAGRAAKDKQPPALHRYSAATCAVGGPALVTRSRDYFVARSISPWPARGGCA
jgi:hypothetical protein